MTGFLVRVGEGVRGLVHRWESLQVELHGSYSVERLISMQKYCRSTSVSRSLVALAAIPIPPLVCVAMVDAFPLQSPDLGLASTGTLWARGVSSGFLDSYALAWMFSKYVPELELSWSWLLLTAFAAVTAVHVSAFCLMVLLWYPLPFTLLWTTGPWLMALALSLKLARRDFLRNHPEVDQEVRRFAIILIMQTTTAVVYTGFNVLFLQVSGKWQMGAGLLVPLFKITQKSVFGRLLRGKDDLKAEMIVLNVEVANALFISSTMQKVKSIDTSVLLVLIDFMQMLTSLFDLNLMLKGVKEIAHNAGVSADESIASALMIAIKYPEVGKQPLLGNGVELSKSEVFRISTLRNILTSRNSTKSGMKPVRMAQVVPTPVENNLNIVPNPPSGGPTACQIVPVENCVFGLTTEICAVIEQMTAQERELLLRKVLQLLFFTEFILLTEFMEVLTPVMYSFYLMILFHWPNREFYADFDGLDEAHFWKTIGNIHVYSLLEAGSFAILVVMIYRTAHIFPFQHLAYTINRSWGVLQCKLVIWLLLLVQSIIPQLGVDYSFKFEWIHKQ